MSGRAATENVIAGRYAISVGDAEMPCPPGWTWRLLTDVARLESGHTPSRNHPEWWGGSVPWIGIKDARPHHGKTIFETVECTNDEGLANSAARLLPAGTVCLSRTASVGYVVVMGKEMATSQDFVNWVCSEAVVPDFLKHLFIAEKESLLRFSKGTTHSTIYFPEVKAFHVCLPPPRQQKRIVAKIEALQARSEAAKEALNAIPPLLEKFRQSVLAAAFRGDLTRTWREAHRDTEPASRLLERIRAERRRRWEEANPKKKYVEPEPVDAAGLPELPEGWCWATFDEVAACRPHALKAGPFGSALKKEFYTPSGHKVYGQEQVIKGDPYFGDYYIDEQRFAELKACEVRPGDILISLVGTIGKVLVLPQDAEAGIINPRLVKLSLSAQVIEAEYAAWALQSPLTLRFFASKSHGGTMEILNLSIIRELRFPLPPLAEQRQMLRSLARTFASLDGFVASRTDAASILTSLNQSILAKAFRGELVHQDPNDEPASVLLERIRLERDAEGNGNGKKERKRVTSAGDPSTTKGAEAHDG